MPHDKSGKFHLGSQRAHAADRVSMPAHTPMGGEEHGMQSHDGSDGDEASTTLHDHGDGTFHTKSHDGEHVEHPDIKSALSHMASKHGGADAMGVCPVCGR